MIGERERAICIYCPIYYFYMLVNENAPMRIFYLLMVVFTLMISTVSKGQFHFCLSEQEIPSMDQLLSESSGQQAIITEKKASKRLIIDLQVDNDMTYFTDHYYSSGVMLNLFAPFMEHSPLNALLLRDRGGDAKSYYALTFTHHMYTPIYIDTLSNRVIDHPFAAYILLGNRKEIFNPGKRHKLVSEFQLGVIGPVAGGQAFQNTLHDHISFAGRVKGWDTQVDNDLCMQYNFLYEKGLVKGKWFDLDAYTGGKLGVPHTEAQIGTGFRIGLMDDYYRTIGTGPDEKLQIWFFCNGDVNLVAYNAVLQGGLLHPGEAKILRKINPVIWHTLFGGTLIYKNLKFELAQEVISRVFPNALWHRWAYVKVMVGF